MVRILFFAIFAVLVFPASGQTLERTYEAVTHIESVETLAVPGDPGRIVGIPSFRGLAIFADGTVVPHQYAGWFDTVNGVGNFRGAAIWRFDDGELRARYDGVVEGTGDDGFSFRATMRDFSGTGRYAGVRGSGSFGGKRVEEIADGGSTYLKGEFSLELAAN